MCKFARNILQFNLWMQSVKEETEIHKATGYWEINKNDERLYFTVRVIRTQCWRWFAFGRHQTKLCAGYYYLNTQLVLIVLTEVRHISAHIERLLSGTALLNISISSFLMLEIIFYLFQWQVTGCWNKQFCKTCERTDLELVVLSVRLNFVTD